MGIRIELYECVLIFFIACASFGCSQTSISSAQTDSFTPHAIPSEVRILTEIQAIGMAEKFVAQNGYTDLPPDRDNLSYKSIEWESNVDAILKSRHTTLEKKAFGLNQKRKNDTPGWTIVFRYAHPSDSTTKRNGCAVTMNLDGSEPRVEHVDFILAKVDKKL
ncbi:MAG: hypothetical protein ACKVRN_04670 [Pyrinomonadaceae bacterium]